MRVHKKTFLPALAFWAALAPSCFAMEPDELFAKVSRSIMLVKTYKADDTLLGTGSAVTIAPGKLVTNCHVLAKAKRIELRQENVSYDASLEHIDVERDLCQVTAKNFNAPAVDIADSDKLRVGQKVYAIGNPRGLEHTLSDGLISSLRKDEQDKLYLIQTSAPISMGSSGGGLFDSNGRLIGITTLTRVDGQNLNFAIPVNWIRDLPERSRITLAKAEASRKAESEKSGSSGKAGKPIERQLSGAEIQTHFSTSHDSSDASTDQHGSIRFTTTPDGVVQLANNRSNGTTGYGIYRIKSDEDQVCIIITSGRLKSVQGCYQMFQSGTNDFVLRGVSDKSFIKYKG